MVAFVTCNPQDQLGVRLALTHVVLNEQPGGVFAQAGPNDAPSVAGGRTCPSYHRAVISGHGVAVEASGIGVALQRFSQWVGGHAPEAGLWHLLTNCFPPAGTVGLAWRGATCLSAHDIVFVDSGVPPDEPDVCDDLYEGTVVATGNCASRQEGGPWRECDQTDGACYANTAVSSFSCSL